MRAIRNWDPGIYRLITIRTVGARLWITPSSNVRKLVGGIIARYQELLGIEIFAYSVLGNHYHLLVKAPEGNIDEFCENVNREFARRLNWKHKREGKFWAKRYDDLEVLSEEDLVEAFLYVNTNPTRHGLIRDSRDWPGLLSFEQSLKETDRRFSFYHYSKEGEFRVSSHKLKLSVLPTFKDLTKKERNSHIEKLLIERMERIATERKERGEGFLELRTLLAQEPGETPRKVSKSDRPCCYTKCAQLLKEFRESERLRREAYTEASIRYRLGLNAEFPSYTFKPPLHRIPRIVPFKPLTPELFKNAA